MHCNTHANEKLESMEDLFVTNRQPTANEENHLRQLVAEGQGKLDAVDSEFTAERTAVVEDLKRYYLALSPIRRLPRDVLPEIFMACLPDIQYPTMSNKEAPMVLTQICSVMRQVALTTPALWATLHISVDQYSALEQSVKPPVPVAAVQEWLERSESLPLRICLNHRGPVPFTYENPYVDMILQVLARFSHRWHTLQIHIPTELSISAISRLTEKDVPRLRYISLPCPNTVPREQDDLRNSSILSTPSLVGLDLYGEANISEIRGLKWGNLNHIRLAWTKWGGINRTQQAMVEVLQQTRRLTSLYLHVLGDTTEHIISLPFLKTLEMVDYCDKESHSIFIASIKAPSLQCLTYNEDLRGFGRSCPITRLTPLLKGSPFLRKLLLGRVTSTKSLKQCLRDCPALEILIIANVGSERRSHSGRFLMSLVNSKTNRCLCPNLEYFWCVEGIHPSPGVLSKFLSRKRAGGPSHLRPWKGLTITIIVNLEIKDTYDKIISKVQADKHIVIAINSADDVLHTPSWWNLHFNNAYRVG